MSTLTRRALSILLLIILAAAFAHQIRPSARMADQGEKLDLETMIPRQFGSWIMEERQSGIIVNPQDNDLQNRLYQQVLSRTYIHQTGLHAIMLSIAYGENQSRSKDLHVPDVCYPAGGFKIEQAEQIRLNTTQASIPAKRLIAQRLSRREPLIYWAIIGEHVATSAISSKLLALSYGLRGTVPDGIIFRVSSIGLPDEEAFAKQQEFIETLLDSLPANHRKRLSGS